MEKHTILRTRDGRKWRFQCGDDEFAEYEIGQPLPARIIPDVPGDAIFSDAIYPAMAEDEFFPREAWVVIRGGKIITILERLPEHDRHWIAKTVLQYDLLVPEVSSWSDEAWANFAKSKYEESFMAGLEFAKPNAMSMTEQLNRVLERHARARAAEGQDAEAVKVAPEKKSLAERALEIKKTITVPAPEFCDCLPPREETSTPAVKPTSHPMMDAGGSVDAGLLKDFNEMVDQQQDDDSSDDATPSWTVHCVLHDLNSLPDDYVKPEGFRESLGVRIDANGSGIEIRPEGYGDAGMEDGYGVPVYLEFHDQQLVLYAFPDINSETPIRISLEGARESTRAVVVS